MWCQHSVINLYVTVTTKGHCAVTGVISLYVTVTTKGHCAVTGVKQYMTTVATLIIHLSLGYFQHTVPSLERDSF
jgi:hypothetical protein